MLFDNVFSTQDQKALSMIQQIYGYTPKSILVKVQNKLIRFFDAQKKDKLSSLVYFYSPSGEYIGFRNGTVIVIQNDEDVSPMCANSTLEKLASLRQSHTHERAYA